MTTFTATQVREWDPRCLVLIDIYCKENPQLPDSQTTEAIEAAFTVETATINGTKPEVALANAKRAGFTDATIEQLWSIDLQFGRSFTLNPSWWLHEDLVEAEAIFRRDVVYELNTDLGCASSVEELQKAGTVKVKPFKDLSREDVETHDPDRSVYCAAFFAVFYKLHEMSAEDRAHVMAPMHYLLTTAAADPSDTADVQQNKHQMRVGMLKFLRDDVNPNVVFFAESLLRQKSVEEIHFMRFKYRAWAGDQLGCGPRQSQTNQIAHHGDMYVSMIYSELLQRRMAAYAALNKPDAGIDDRETYGQVFTFECALADLNEARQTFGAAIKEKLATLTMDDIKSYDPDHFVRTAALMTACDVLGRSKDQGSTSITVSGPHIVEWVNEAEEFIRLHKDPESNSDLVKALLINLGEKVETNPITRNVMKIVYSQLLCKHFFPAEYYGLNRGRAPPQTTASISTPTTAACTPRPEEHRVGTGSSPDPFKMAEDAIQVEPLEDMFENVRASWEEEDEVEEKAKTSSTYVTRLVKRSDAEDAEIDESMLENVQTTWQADEEDKKKKSIAIAAHTAATADAEADFDESMLESAKAAWEQDESEPNVIGPAPANSATSRLQPGDAVFLRNLHEMPELNGLFGTLVACDAKKARWHVRLDGDRRSVWIKAENIKGESDLFESCAFESSKATSGVRRSEVRPKKCEMCSVM